MAAEVVASLVVGLQAAEEEVEEGTVVVAREDATAVVARAAVREVVLRAAVTEVNPFVSAMVSACSRCDGK